MDIPVCVCTHSSTQCLMHLALKQLLERGPARMVSEELMEELINVNNNDKPSVLLLPVTK